MTKVKIYIHYLMPKRLLTVCVGLFASSQLGKLTTLAIKYFVKFYNINTREIKGKITDYKTFNDFFARELKNKVRPIDNSQQSLVYPADGRISQFGDLISNIQIQAKGHYFSTAALLGNDDDSKTFKDGKFITTYLSPRDYHRVHIPIDGKLLKMTYIPGELFSVNPLYTQNIPELFARNERVVCIFDTPCGKMAVILVGATIVRSITTKWAGVVAPNASKTIKSWDYKKESISFHKGDEIGKFTMGSTVICLFEKGKISFSDHIRLEQHVLVGQAMANISSKKKK